MDRYQRSVHAKAILSGCQSVAGRTNWRRFAIGIRSFGLIVAVCLFFVGFIHEVRCTLFSRHYFMFRVQLCDPLTFRLWFRASRMQDVFLWVIFY